MPRRRRVTQPGWAPRAAEVLDPVAAIAFALTGFRVERVAAGAASQEPPDASATDSPPAA